jgi:hypothetical protein
MKFDILYDPYAKSENPFNWLIRAPHGERGIIIDKYPYDISAITDDNPFFFQYYRWRSLTTKMKSSGGVPINQLPLGLLVLLVSLVQILVLAGISIILPLLPQRSLLRQMKHKWRLLAYFGALGLGFITVEITLLQKYAVFVGGPIYSMAITLFAILVFSGLGSLLAQRIGGSISRKLTIIFIVLAGAIAGETLFVNLAIPKLMFLPHEARCLVAILALAPLATVIGMPFPTGIRFAQSLDDSIVPWAWGINAVTTTLGSIACILASMEVGFTASLLAAGIIYIVGFVALRPVTRAV